MLTTVLVVSAIGGIFGIILIAADKKLQVAVDERTANIISLLPGANCGACGSPGCEAFAAAIVELNMNINYCVACSEENKNKIAAIMGMKAEASTRKLAYIACRGCDNPAAELYEYQGIKDCFAVAKFFSGTKVCNYTCLGLGNCVHNCPFGAIFINERGVAEVDTALCAGCGVCTAHCPQNLITLTPAGKTVRIFCNNRNAGKKAVDVCNTACISCGICIRTCPSSAISMFKDGSKSIAVIDYEKCTNCGICIEKCPKKCIANTINKDYNAPQTAERQSCAGGCLHCQNKIHS